MPQFAQRGLNFGAARLGRREDFGGVAGVLGVSGVGIHSLEVERSIFRLLRAGLELANDFFLLANLLPEGVELLGGGEPAPGEKGFLMASIQC